MRFGDDRMGALLPLGPLAARTVVCKLSHLRRRRLRKRSSLRPAAASSRCRSGSGEPRTRSPTRRPSAALDRRQRHLGLERRPVLLACLLHVLLPRHRRFLGAGLHLNQLSRFRGPPHLLLVPSIGLAYPWRTAALERFKLRHTLYGNLPGRFEATGGQLFGRI